jgi:hypothetical protein
MKKKSKPMTYDEAMSLIPEIMQLTKGLEAKVKADQTRLAYEADIKTIFRN